MATHPIVRTRAAAIAACAIALTLAFGTGAFAAAKITSADIKDHTIQSKDLKKGSVTTKVLHGSAVKSKKINNGAVHNPDIHTGAVQSGTIKDGTVAQKDLDSALKTLLPARVNNLTGSFTITNPSVTLTPDGVSFGPYADGGTQGGSIVYGGLNGKPLSAVENLVYYARYVGNTTGALYLRVWTENDANSAVFDPTSQTPDPDITPGPFHEWVATSGSWRYNDDPGNGPDESFADLLAAHGTETISRVTITTGFSNGTNLQALLRWWQINGKTYTFGS